MVVNGGMETLTFHVLGLSFSSSSFELQSGQKPQQKHSSNLQGAKRGEVPLPPQTGSHPGCNEANCFLERNGKECPQWPL